MKKHTVLFCFTGIFFTVQPAQPQPTEKLPEFFCLVVWTQLWERHKNSDHLPLKDEDSSLTVTAFVPLFHEERHLNLYLHRLHETGFLPHVILKVKTDALCRPEMISSTFSKDRFGHYRFNATLIPKRAIVESKIITKKDGSP